MAGSDEANDKLIEINPAAGKEADKLHNSIC
jgi:hypothetical protein